MIDVAESYAKGESEREVYVCMHATRYVFDGRTGLIVVEFSRNLVFVVRTSLSRARYFSDKLIGRVQMTKVFLASSKRN
jgi:hypothetical protein